MVSRSIGTEFYRVVIIAAIAIIYPLLRILSFLKLWRTPDPWRRTVGLGLRSEGTKFALSAFGLPFESGRGQVEDISARIDVQRIFLRRFAEFLRNEPAAHFALVHHPFHVERTGVRYVDVALGRFYPNGELCELEIDFDSRAPIELPSSLSERIHEMLISAHRETRLLPECARPRLLRKVVRTKIDQLHESERNRAAAWDCAKRVLRSCIVSFDEETGRLREWFLAPDFRYRQNFGHGVLNVVCRLDRRGDSVDLWLQVHHTGADGAVMQELLQRLENCWGVLRAQEFPAGGLDGCGIRSCEVPIVEFDVTVGSEFFDFRPMFAWRNQLKQRHRDIKPGEIPVVALLLWKLAQQDEFRNRRFAVAVDVPADQRFARAVDLISLAPFEYGRDWCDDELIEFVAEFNQLAALARKRRTPTYRAMERLAILPAFLASAALEANKEASRRAFGTVGISILRDAKVFVGPMSDSGFDDGFIAVGSMTLQSRNGGNVGCVTVKGARARVTEVLTSIRRALAD